MLFCFESTGKLGGNKAGISMFTDYRSTPEQNLGPPASREGNRLVTKPSHFVGTCR